MSNKLTFNFTCSRDEFNKLVNFGNKPSFTINRNAKTIIEAIENSTWGYQKQGRKHWVKNITTANTSISQGLRNGRINHHVLNVILVHFSICQNDVGSNIEKLHVFLEAIHVNELCSPLQKINALKEVNTFLDDLFKNTNLQDFGLRFNKEWKLVSPDSLQNVEKESQEPEVSPVPIGGLNSQNKNRKEEQAKPPSSKWGILIVDAIALIAFVTSSVLIWWPEISPETTKTTTEETQELYTPPVFSDRNDGSLHTMYRVIVYNTGITKDGIDFGLLIKNTIDSINYEDNRGTFSVKYITLTDNDLKKMQTGNEFAIEQRFYNNADMVIYPQGKEETCTALGAHEICVKYICNIRMFSTRDKHFTNDKLYRDQSSITHGTLSGNIQNLSLKICSLMSLANARYNVGGTNARNAIVYANSFDKKDITGHLIKAKAYSWLSKKDSAFIEYTDVVSIDRENSEGWFERAICNPTQQGMFLDYDNAIYVNSTNYQAYYNRGETYAKLGYIENAIDDFKTALSLVYTDDPRISDFIKKQISSLENGKGLLRLETLIFTNEAME